MRTHAAVAAELTTQHLLVAAARGAGYLAQNLLPSGRFVYQRCARTGEPIAGRYNLLRHFGSIWAMLDVRGYDPAMQEKAARSIEWAIENYYVETRQGGAFRKKEWLVTGCSGLALLALDELDPEHAPTRRPTSARSWSTTCWPTRSRRASCGTTSSTRSRSGRSPST